MTTDTERIYINGHALTFIARDDNAEERAAYDDEIMERFGSFQRHLPDKTVWAGRERCLLVHRYIEAGAGPWIVSRCLRRVGEGFSRAGAAEVREIVAQSFTNTAQGYHDVGTMYTVISMFVAETFRAIAEHQAAERHAALPIPRRTAEIRGQDGAVIRTISIPDQMVQPHRNGNGASRS